MGGRNEFLKLLETQNIFNRSSICLERKLRNWIQWPIILKGEEEDPFTLQLK